MNPNGQPYTPPYGYTPQGQAVATAQPNANNTVAPNIMSQVGGGQPLSSDQLGQLTGAYGNASAQLGNMQTSDARQSYVTNSNLPGMQQNYEQLAQQLAAYDQGVLAPQFQGQNPGMSPDAASFGRVDASPLALTQQGAGLPANQGLFVGNANPKYAYTAQAGQANSIVDLLSALNSSIGQEFTQRAGTYKNTVGKQQALLDSINNILGLNQQASLKKADIESQKTLEAMQEANQRIIAGINAGLIDPATGKPWASGADAESSDPQSLADAVMGGYKKWGDVPTGMQAAVAKAIKGRGGNVQKIIDGYKAFDDSLNTLNKIEDLYGKMNDLEKHIPQGAAEQISAPWAEINSLFFGSLEPSMRSAIVSGRITQQEINWIKNAFIPGPFNSPEAVQKKLAALRWVLEERQKNTQYLPTNYSVGDQSIGIDKQNQNNTSQNKTSGGFIIKQVK